MCNAELHPDYFPNIYRTSCLHQFWISVKDNDLEFLYRQNIVIWYEEEYQELTIEMRMGKGVFKRHNFQLPFEQLTKEYVETKVNLCLLYQ